MTTCDAPRIYTQLNTVTPSYACIIAMLLHPRYVSPGTLSSTTQDFGGNVLTNVFRTCDARVRYLRESVVLPVSVTDKYRQKTWC